MSIPFHPEFNGIAQLFPFGADDTRDGIFVSLKNVHRAFLVVIVEQGADATQHTFTLKQATAGAGTATGTSEKAMTNSVPIYYNEDCALDNTVTAATAAKTYQTDTAQSKTKMVIFDIVPQSCMDLANNFDCVGLDSTDLGAANIAGAFAILVPDRYAPLPTVFSD